MSTSRYIAATALALLLVSAAWTSEARAEQPIPAYTLPDAIEAAMSQNPELMAYAMTKDAAGGDVASAWGRVLPKVYAEERVTRTNNPTYSFMSKLNEGGITASDMSLTNLNNPTHTNDFQTSLTLEQVLYSRQAGLGIKMAGAEREATGMDFARRRESVALDVTKAYLGVAATRSFVDVAQRGLDDANEHLRIAKLRVESGLAKESDVLRTVVMVREAEETLLRARKAHAMARRGLGLVIGLGGPADALDAPMPIETGGIDELLARAKERTDLKAMAIRAGTAKDNVKTAKAAYLPTAGASVTWQMNSGDAPMGRDNDSYTAVVFLHWDLFDSSRGGKRARAEAERRQAEYMYDAMSRGVEYKVHAAYMDLAEAREGLALARSREILAEETKRIVALRYENSLATVVELMDAQTALNAARAEAVGRESALRQAAASLAFESGAPLAPHAAESN